MYAIKTITITGGSII